MDLVAEKGFEPKNDSWLYTKDELPYSIPLCYDWDICNMYIISTNEQKKKEYYYASQINNP